MRTEIETRRSHQEGQSSRHLAWREGPLGKIVTRDLKIRADVQYSGSIGHLTYGHNSGGQYIRSRSIPTNPNTERQGEVRGFLANFASQWATALTQAHRDAWRTYAENHTHKDAFGENIHIPAHCWFIMFNTRVVDAGLPGMADPPPDEGPAGFLTFVCDLSADNTCDVTWTAALPADAMVQLWQSLPVSVGSSPNFKQARLVGYSPQDQASPWAATLPHPVVAGKRAVFFGAMMDAHGQISAYSTDIEDR